MFNFSKRSKDNLDSCHKDLRTLFNQVIRYFDCSILDGHRLPEQQFFHFKRGRKLINGKWVIIDKSKILTYMDGYKKKSKHNQNPSLAVDVAPYPINFKDEKRIILFAGFVLGIAEMLRQQGKIKSLITWGGDWKRNFRFTENNFEDFPHFEIHKTLKQGAKKMEKLKKAVKTKTFWGGFIYAIGLFLETQGLIPISIVNIIELIGVSIGLFGARNTGR